jgi:hypothetical protein
MTPEQMALVRGFATGLAALKAKQELGHGAELTSEEVAGIIWAIKQLRGGSARVPADPPAQR